MFLVSVLFLISLVAIAVSIFQRLRRLKKRIAFASEQLKTGCQPHDRALRYFNETILLYNASVTAFPTSWIARLGGFEPEPIDR